MKIVLISIFIFLNYTVFSQIKLGKDGNGFNSFYQNLTQGTYTGLASGVIEIHSENDGNFNSSFFEDTVGLSIKPDSNEIYDVSTKIYNLNKSDFQLLYHTYGRANALFVTIKSKKYELNLIDGSCDAVINGLDYKYISNDKVELLILHFSEDVNLFRDRSSYSKPELTIRKGSTLIISTNKLVKT